MYLWLQVASLHGAGGLLPCLLKASFIGAFCHEVFSIDNLCFFALCLSWLYSNSNYQNDIPVFLPVYGSVDALDGISGLSMGET